MPQEFLRDWISDHLTKHEAKVVAAALTRMGLRDAPAGWDTLRWELLDWFVKYARVDLAQSSESQLNQLEEEIQVLQILGSFNLDPWIPSKQEMRELQGRVSTVLHDLVERKSTHIGPIAIEFIIYRGDTREDGEPMPSSAKGVVMLDRMPVLLGTPPAEGIAFQVPPVGQDSVLHCLAQLLAKYPGSVRKCRACEKLFARFKWKSRSGEDSYCSRQCQNRAWAKGQYARKKAKQPRRQNERDGRAH